MVDIHGFYTGVEEVYSTVKPSTSGEDILTSFYQDGQIRQYIDDISWAKTAIVEGYKFLPYDLEEWSL